MSKIKIVGVDLHAKQQSIAMLDNETGKLTERAIHHEGNAVREFDAAWEGPVVVGLEGLPGPPSISMAVSTVKTRL